jgi:thioesterase domain-containing protein
MSVEVLRELAPAERLKYFQNRLAIADLPLAQFSEKQLQGLLNVFKVQGEIDYQTNGMHQNQIVVFKATEVSQESSENIDIAKDWQQFSTKSIVSYITPGNHYRMMSEPHVQALVTNLRDCINQAGIDE